MMGKFVVNCKGVGVPFSTNKLKLPLSKKSEIFYCEFMISRTNGGGKTIFRFGLTISSKLFVVRFVAKSYLETNPNQIAISSLTINQLIH